jgi:hypothetical protein
MRKKIQSIAITIKITITSTSLSNILPANNGGPGSSNQYPVSNIWLRLKAALRIIERNPGRWDTGE